MPCVRMATGKWAVGSEMMLIEAVQSALVSAFKIPEGDRDVVIDLYDESRRIVSTGRSERYTRIEIVGIAARSMDAKRAVQGHRGQSPSGWRATRRDANFPDRASRRKLRHQGRSAGIRSRSGVQGRCVVKLRGAVDVSSAIAMCCRFFRSGAALNSATQDG